MKKRFCHSSVPMAPKGATMRKMVVFVLAISAFSVVSHASRAPYDKATLEAESKQVAEIAAAGDVDGLIQILTGGLFPSKVLAAEYLGEIGDQSALPTLEGLNEEHGAWTNSFSTGQEYSGAFAVAICRILTRDHSTDEQIEALFELLEGRGPAVPKSAEFTTTTVNNIQQDIHNSRLKRNYDVGKRVAAELDQFDDSTIVERLRQTENRGAAIPAVWMEVREMESADAIARCVEITRDERGAQRYGAIHCLDKFGTDAIDALDQLAKEGHPDAVTVLGYQKENPRVFDLLCWHLLNNNNSQVRWASVSPTAYVQSDNCRLKSLKTLIAALYDSNENIRRNASSLLNSRAYRQNKSYFDQIEESLLIAALRHPDQEVRGNLMKAVVRLGYEWSDEQVGESPAIRTDIDADSQAKELEFKALLNSLEKTAANQLKTGPPEEAIKLYEELLVLKPACEAYELALEKAKAYVKAAETATEYWYPDAPYIGLKGRYSYYLAGIPEDTTDLKEKFELAHEQLATTYYPEWSGIFSKKPKPTDQYVKALRLFEHIVEYYPENEYLVIRSREAIGGFNFNLYRDKETYVLAGIDLLTVDVKDIVDSTNECRNEPLKDFGGRTQAQLDFEQFYKDAVRDRLIEICTSHARELKNAGQYDQNLFDEIIERCDQTDPTIVEMAKNAKAKLELESIH